jgi:hypothetical protein
MRRNTSEPTTRRALLGRIGRWAGFAGLAALAGGLLARSRRRDGCTRAGACGHCPLRTQCRLPAAEAARKK